MNTILFWCLVAAMTLAALAFVMLPLLRGRTGGEVSRRDTNIALYRERQREIEQAVAAGRLGADEAKLAMAELDSRLLVEAGQPVSGPARADGPRARYALGLALLLLLPGLAIGIYLHNSDWQLALAGNGHQAMSLLLQRLERRLEQEPENIEGWRLLAKSLTELRRFDGAARAYARLNALAPDADSLAGEAEVLALAADGNLQGRPASLLEQALRMDPQSARALWYAGLAARQRGDDAAAVGHWMRIAQQEMPDEVRQMLNAQIVQAGGKPPAAAAAFQIRIQVSLTPGLADQVTAEMPVFIYARAEGQAGGPPLAAVRRKVSDLPLSIVLDDSQSMLPDRKLSSVDRWTITARIARQGSAETRSGDLLADTVLAREQLPKPVQLTIDHAVP